MLYLSTEDAVSALVGSKLNFMKHLTMMHPDVFLEMPHFKVGEWMF